MNAHVPDNATPSTSDDVDERAVDTVAGTADSADENAVALNARLAPEARRAVVTLLKQGAVLATDKRVIFEAICRHRQPLEAHLADMYLRLLIDERAGVALILQSDPDEAEGDEDETATALISRRSMTLYETLLILVLRKHYQDRQSSGEQSVFIDLDRIESGLTPFLPLTTSTRSDRHQLAGALKNMLKHKILARARGTQDLFEITPVIRYVVSAASLEHLLAQYTSLLAQSPGTGDGSTTLEQGDGDEDD